MQKSDYWKGLVMIMNKNCNIVRDLIPLYSDNTASDESRKFIEEHCRTCDECNHILSLSKTEIDKTVHLDDEINSVWKSIEKQNKKKRIIKVAIAAILVTVLIPLIIIGANYMYGADNTDTAKSPYFSDEMLNEFDKGYSQSDQKQLEPLVNDLGEKYRNILGYLPQNFGYYPNFTAYKFLMYISAIKGLPPKKAHNRTMELLQVVDLLTQKNEKIKTFSGGMKQRLGIAQALLNDPRILILDEPTAGLDPKERVRFRNLISSLAENRIVILSTHIVSDVEYIANEILIMKNGELIQHGSPEEILKPIEKCVWECDVSRKEAEELELNYITANLKHNNGAERLRIISQEAPCRTAWNVDPTLEDLYLYYFAEVSEHE